MHDYSIRGRGGGLVVSDLAFFSNNQSSNPACNLNFLYEKTKINEKEAVVTPSLKNDYSISSKNIIQVVNENSA